ncbi:hypothetical protein PsYK624_017790 [Phanerochaete sordida]|uniref:Uncharacterized protein n=1 Tax=Phanerochaete sordida TaxID=48140 RepID=A0A9P3G0H5_9APHY|nr:hypothetical protein PsYK624_017790 [Phanerochaete sordida]
MCLLPVNSLRYIHDPLGEHRNFRWARGLAHTFTKNDTHCVTALNVSWVPLLIVGIVNLSLRSDGRFGVEDPLNWPQFYSASRPHLAFIPKRPHTPGTLSYTLQVYLCDLAIVGGDVRCKVLAGDAHLAAIVEESEAILNIEHIALPAVFGLDDEKVEEENRGRKGKGKATQRVQALERFKALDHELLPARLAVWQEALDTLNVSKPCKSLVGLWFPEPEMFVMPQNKLRLMVYISNWMTIRMPLFGLLGRATLHLHATQKTWRTLLARFPEQSEDEKQVSEGQRTPASTSKSAAAGGIAKTSSTLLSQAIKRKEAAQKRYQQKEAVCAYFTALLGFQQPLKLRVEPISSFV